MGYGCPRTFIALPYDVLGDMIVACIVPKRTAGATPAPGPAAASGASGTASGELPAWATGDAGSPAGVWLCEADLVGRLRAAARRGRP